MNSSKASRCFQCLEIGYPFLPKKLQGSPIKFLVLEQDSLDLEDLPFRVDFQAYNLGVGLEEVSLPIEFLFDMAKMLMPKLAHSFYMSNKRNTSRIRALKPIKLI